MDIKPDRRTVYFFYKNLAQNIAAKKLESIKLLSFVFHSQINFFLLLNFVGLKKYGQTVKHMRWNRDWMKCKNLECTMPFILQKNNMINNV